MKRIILFILAAVTLIISFIADRLYKRSNYEGSYVFGNQNISIYMEVTRKAGGYRAEWEIVDSNSRYEYREFDFKGEEDIRLTVFDDDILINFTENIAVFKFLQEDNSYGYILQKTSYTDTHKESSFVRNILRLLSGMFIIAGLFVLAGGKRKKLKVIITVISLVMASVYILVTNLKCDTSAQYKMVKKKGSLTIYEYDMNIQKINGEYFLVCYTRANLRSILLSYYQGYKNFTIPLIKEDNSYIIPYSYEDYKEGLYLEINYDEIEITPSLNKLYVKIINDGVTEEKICLESINGAGKINLITDICAMVLLAAGIIIFYLINRKKTRVEDTCPIPYGTYICGKIAYANPVYGDFINHASKCITGTSIIVEKGRLKFLGQIYDNISIVEGKSDSFNAISDKRYHKATVFNADNGAGRFYFIKHKSGIEFMTTYMNEEFMMFDLEVPHED